MAWKFFTSTGAEKKTPALVVNPVCKMHTNAAVALPNTSTVQIPVTTTVIDTGAMADTVNGRIVIKTAGKYRCTSIVDFIANASGGRAVYVHKNGVTQYNVIFASPNLSPNDVRLGGSVILDLNAGDWLQPAAWQGSGGPISLVSSIDVEGGTASAILMVEKIDGAIVQYASPLLGNTVYSATPPTSPVDGQFWIYPAGANGENWTYRYNAGSASAYKWEFNGGPPVGVNRFTPDSLTADGTFKLDNLLGGLTTSRAGEYRIISYAYGNLSASGTQTVSMTYAQNGTPGAAIAQSAALASFPYNLNFNYKTVAAAGDVFINAYSSNGTGSFTISSRCMTITPIRVA